MELVFLDLETTGLNINSDKIIEIGLICVKDGKIIDKFESLVKIKEDVPKITTAITGITNNDLEQAPILEDLREKISNFIREKPIAGHNISFDAEFLKKKGFIINSSYVDTLILSQIVFPGEESYALEALTATKNIKHKEKHRAMADTMAELDLFKLILEKINNIPPKILTEIRRFLKKTDWGGKIAFEEKTVKTENIESPAVKNKQLSIDFAEKQKNTKLTNEIKNKKNIICEAGNKRFLSYIEYAQENKNILIAYKKEQTKEKILTSAKNISVLEIKDKNSYLCIEKLKKFKEKEKFSNEEIILLIKIILYFNDAKNGTTDEFNVKRNEFYIWKDNLVCGESCRNCFYNRAKRSSAAITVTHQKNLLKERFPQKHIIIDDIEEMKDSVEKGTGETISQKEIERKYSDPKLDMLFASMILFMEDYTESVNYKGALLVTPKIKETQEFKNIKESIKKLKGQKKLEKLYNFFDKQNDNELFLISTNRNQEVFLSRIPLDVGKVLQEKLWNQNKTFSLLGNSISVGKKFDYIKKLLSIPDRFSEHIILEKPVSDVKIVIPSDFPSPQKEEFFYKTNELLKEIKENTLIIYNSYRSIENTYLELFKKIKQSAFLAQGINGGYGKIKIAIKNKEKIILLSNSYLLDSLSDEDNKFQNLIITRLPFSPPSDPVEKARSGLFDNSFGNYTIPSSILKFKSIINKFIAGPNAKNIIILDNRIIYKDYGKAFLQNIPDTFSIKSLKTRQIFNKIG